MDESFAQWKWTHAYVENVASAIVLAATDERSIDRIYNVGENDTPTIHEFTKSIGEQIEWRGEIIVLPKDRLPTSYHFPLNTLQQLVADTSLIRAELNYHEKVSWIEGLKRTIPWEVEHLPINTNPKYQNIDYHEEDAQIMKMGIC